MQKDVDRAALAFGSNHPELCIEQGDMNDVDFGKVDLGNAQLKHLPNASLGVESSDILQLIVNDDYTYPARSFDAALKTQRIDVGKGLRGTWFNLKLTGTDGADFRLESIDFIPATTKRRI